MDSESRSESAPNSPMEADVSLAASLTDPVEITTMEEAKQNIKDLKTKYRAQAHQLMTWRRACRHHEELISRLRREKTEELRSLSSRLLLFESRLVRKQKEINHIIKTRESIISKQQKAIEELQAKLLEYGIEAAQAIPDYREMLQGTQTVGDFDSLNDSDSAVIMEDVDSDCNLPNVPRFRSTAESVTVARSISDAIDPKIKYNVNRRPNIYLRRPEVLETVYSVEEEADADSMKGISAQNSTEKELKDTNRSDDGQSIDRSLLAQRRDNFRMRSVVLTADDDEAKGNGESWAYSYLPKKTISDDDVTESEDEETARNPVVTYNRVMSNHRNVTKPKDVKYKRINKAKSKSLEELRGRLKNWVDKGNKFANLTLDNAQNYD